jgi:hypothetical protein
MKRLDFLIAILIYVLPLFLMNKVGLDDAFSYILFIFWGSSGWVASFLYLEYIE